MTLPVLIPLLRRCTLTLDVNAAAESAAPPASPDDLTLEDGDAFDAYRRAVARSGGDGQRVCSTWQQPVAHCGYPRRAWPDDDEGSCGWHGQREWRCEWVKPALRPADSYSYAGHCGGDPDTAEIIAALAAATPDDITVLDYASTFGDQRYRLASGWEVVVNWKRGEPNYIDEVIAPDGRRWGFDHMHYEVRDWCRFLEFVERWPWCRDVREGYPEEVRARARLARVTSELRRTNMADAGPLAAWIRAALTVNYGRGAH